MAEYYALTGFLFCSSSSLILLLFSHFLLSSSSSFSSFTFFLQLPLIFAKRGWRREEVMKRTRMKSSLMKWLDWNEEQDDPMSWMMRMDHLFLSLLHPYQKKWMRMKIVGWQKVLGSFCWTFDMSMRRVNRLDHDLGMILLFQLLDFLFCEFANTWIQCHCIRGKYH